MRYLMIHDIDESILTWNDHGHEAEDPEVARALDVWDAEMIARGILVGGAVLRPVRDTTTVRIRGGELLVSDGPYAETKEQIAGFDLLQCADLDAALEVAARHPTARIGTFELRPLVRP